MLSATSSTQATGSTHDSQPDNGPHSNQQPNDPSTEQPPSHLRPPDITPSATRQVLTHIDTVSAVLHYFPYPADLAKLSKLCHSFTKAALPWLKRWFRDHINELRVTLGSVPFEGFTSVVRGWDSATVSFLPKLNAFDENYQRLVLIFWANLHSQHLTVLCNSLALESAINLSENLAMRADYTKLQVMVDKCSREGLTPSDEFCTQVIDLSKRFEENDHKLKSFAHNHHQFASNRMRLGKWMDDYKAFAAKGFPEESSVYLSRGFTDMMTCFATWDGHRVSYGAECYRDETGGVPFDSLSETDELHVLHFRKMTHLCVGNHTFRLPLPKVPAPAETPSGTETSSRKPHNELPPHHFIRTRHESTFTRRTPKIHYGADWVTTADGKPYLVAVHVTCSISQWLEYTRL